MGANTFSTRTKGKSPREAFQAAQTEARYEHGHGARGDVIDALNIAHSMLCIVQNGGSLTTDAWYEHMQKIEKVLNAFRK